MYRNIKDWVLVDDLGIDIHFVKEKVIVGPQSRSTDKFLHGKIKKGQYVYDHCTGAKGRAATATSAKRSSATW